MARGLTLKAGDPKGEEFPQFRAFWIEQPSAQSDRLVIHALLDSESVCGAYRFTVRAGDVSIIDTEITLFPRAPVENYGIGGMTTTYLFGANDRRGVDDVRPSVFESSGLQIKNGNEEWIWRPLQNPDTLQISAFVDPSPRGFGLLQRERDYSAFLDDDQNFERRPSLWIEPIGEWGPGLVQLIEIPTDNEINDNVLCYWRPKQPLGCRRRSQLRLSAVLVLAAAGTSKPAAGDGNAGRARQKQCPAQVRRRFLRRGVEIDAGGARR